MRRFIYIVIGAFILVCGIVLFVNAQSKQGILNDIEKPNEVKSEHTAPNQNEEYEEQIAKSETAAVKKQAESDEAIIIVLDPGHQERPNLEQEPIGPGAVETKPKVVGGTTGVVTNKPEYELTLEASFLLQEALEEKGFNVILTRESNQVDISNSERAQVANDRQADLFLRIHADGAESAEAKGFSLLIPGEENHYTEKIYEESLLAAEHMLAHIEAEISLHQDGLIVRNDLSGFNWSEVPVALVELGFMTNPEEDRKLADETYIGDLSRMLADGVEAYIEEKKQ